MKKVYVITKNTGPDEGDFRSNVAVSLNKEDAVLAIQNFQQQHEKLIKINNHLDGKYNTIRNEMLKHPNTKSLSYNEFQIKIADALFDIAIIEGANEDDLKKLGLYKDENGNVYEKSYLDNDSYFSYEEVEII